MGHGKGTEDGELSSLSYSGSGGKGLLTSQFRKQWSMTLINLKVCPSLAITLQLTQKMEEIFQYLKIFILISKEVTCIIDKLVKFQHVLIISLSCYSLM